MGCPDCTFTWASPSSREKVCLRGQLYLILSFGEASTLSSMLTSEFIQKSSEQEWGQEGKVLELEGILTDL